MTRGEIQFVDFGVPQRSVAGYRRPAVVLQNDDFNKSNIGTSGVYHLQVISFQPNNTPSVIIPKKASKLYKDSVAIIPLVTALDKNCFLEKISKMPANYLKMICKGVIEVLELSESF